jgi:hypothetical protein
MRAVRPTCVLVVAAVLVAPTPARAERWPDLQTYVKECSLIVYCKTEVKDRTVRYRVVESWKGEYRPDLFYHRPPPGYLYTGTWHGNEGPADGREVIFFFTADNQPAWANGKLLDHSTSFVVSGGKVVYASTNFGMRREYTVPEFKKAVLDAAKGQRADPVAAAAGGVPAPSQSPSGAFTWWGAGGLGLAALVIAGYGVRARRRGKHAEPGPAPERGGTS